MNNSQKNPEAKIIPTVGRMVLFTCGIEAIEKINKRRADTDQHMDEHRANSNGVQVHVGNTAHMGTVYPAVIVAVWGEGPNALVNLKVMLDGTDDFWATSVHVADEPTPGSYHWMPYQKGQAAKTEMLEAQLAAPITTFDHGSPEAAVEEAKAKHDVA